MILEDTERYCFDWGFIGLLFNKSTSLKKYIFRYGLKIKILCFDWGFIGFFVGSYLRGGNGFRGCGGGWRRWLRFVFGCLTGRCSSSFNLERAISDLSFYPKLEI